MGGYLLIFKTYSLLDAYFDETELDSVQIEIDFAIEKLISFLHLSEGKYLDTKDIVFFSSKFEYNHAIFRKGGNQTLFNAFMPLDNHQIPEITIKFFNERIKPEAVIQFLAGYQYVRKKDIIFEMEINDKIIIVEPAKILYFALYNFNLGKTKREIPILVQENVGTKFKTKNYLTRKELSDFSKLIAKRNFAFDSYESNFIITDIQKKDGKELYNCSYIDMFQLLDYEAIKGEITKIIVKINKNK